MYKQLGSLVIVGILVLSGCSNATDKETENLAANENLLTITEDFDYAYDLSDNKELSDHHAYIALVEITELKGTSNYNDKVDEYVNIYTYGNAVVKKVYKGNLNENDAISFTRLGGKLEYSEWVKGLNERQKERLVDSSYTAVVSHYENDIEVEVGKEYLVFLDHTDSQKDNEYAITGFAYGMREVEEESQTMRNSELRVKNNVTGEYESIQDVVIIE